MTAQHTYHNGEVKYLPVVNQQGVGQAESGPKRGATAVVGVGDLLRGDDGLGPIVVQKLMSLSLPEDIHLIDLGSSLMDLPILVKNPRKVVIVDAMKRGKEAGTVDIIRIRSEDIPSLRTDVAAGLSLHELDVEHVMALSKSLRSCPESFTIIGCEPADLSYGHIGLSPQVESKLGEIIDLVIHELES